MQQKVNWYQGVNAEWRAAWADRSFRIKFIVVIPVLLLILISFPSFFGYIEKRPGIFLDDYLLRQLPPADMSVPIFIIIWGMTLLWLLRCVQRAAFALLVLHAFTILCIVRTLTIYFVPLDPPAGLIPLADPFTSVFYGGPDIFMTRDLFFSGHTSIQFLIFLTMEKKSDKIAAALSTLSIAMLVLVQHVHYSIDVIGAFVFTYAVYVVARKTSAYQPAKLVLEPKEL